MKQYFKEVPAAPAYKISLKGELTNTKGFPVTPVDGKVRITTKEGRKFFTIAQLVKDTWGQEMVVEVPAPAAAPPAPAAKTPEDIVADIAANLKEVKKPVTKKEFEKKIRENKSFERLGLDIAVVIKNKFNSGKSKKELSLEYNVDPRTINRLIAKATPPTA